MKKLIVLLLVIAGLSAGAYYYMQTTPGVTVDNLAQSLTQKAGETIETVAETFTDPSSASPTVIAQSFSVNSEQEQKEADAGPLLSTDDEIYAAMCEAISSHETEITFLVPSSYSDGSRLSELFTQAFKLHPGWFWLNGSARWQMSTLNNTVVTLSLDVINSSDDIASMEAALNNMAEEIAAGAMQYDSDYDRTAYVHNCIINICDYDTDTYYEAASGNTAATYSYTSYGCLVQGKAVCDGYAKAFMLIMNRLGIGCGYVTGIGYNDFSTGSHAWNYVILDGVKYYVDVTWDDPVGDVPEGYISYDYFCISEEQMNADHTTEEET